MDRNTEAICVSSIPGNEKAMDAQALAAALSCDVSSISRMARLGTIPSFCVGAKLGERRFLYSKVVQALEAASRGPIRSKQRKAQMPNG
jgi:hypothetical protein